MPADSHGTTAQNLRLQQLLRALMTYLLGDVDSRIADTLAELESLLKQTSNTAGDCSVELQQSKLSLADKCPSIEQFIQSHSVQHETSGAGVGAQRRELLSEVSQLQLKLEDSIALSKSESAAEPFFNAQNRLPSTQIQPAEDKISPSEIAQKSCETDRMFSRRDLHDLFATSGPQTQFLQQIFRTAMYKLQETHPHLAEAVRLYCIHDARVPRIAFGLNQTPATVYRWLDNAAVLLSGIAARATPPEPGENGGDK